jgi:hypothetical protein
LKLTKCLIRVLRGCWKLTCQYWSHKVCIGCVPPCALITAVYLRLMEPMTRTWKSCGMSFHSWMRSLPSCCRFVGCGGRWRNRHSISSQTCSICRVCWPWQYINVVFVQNMTDNQYVCVGSLPYSWRLVLTVKYPPSTPWKLRGFGHVYPMKCAWLWSCLPHERCMALVMSTPWKVHGFGHVYPMKGACLWSCLPHERCMALVMSSSWKVHGFGHVYPMKGACLWSCLPHERCMALVMFSSWKVHGCGHV